MNGKFISLLTRIHLHLKSHLYHKYLICPHLRCPFGQGTSETLRWGTRWGSNPPGLTQRRSSASPLLWRCLPSRPVKVKQEMKPKPAYFAQWATCAAESPHRKGLSDVDETVHLHDVSHPLNNVSKKQNGQVRGDITASTSPWGYDNRNPSWLCLLVNPWWVTQYMGMLVTVFVLRTHKATQLWKSEHTSL